MSANPISDKELSALLKLAAAALEDGDIPVHDLIHDLDHAAMLLDHRMGVDQ